MSVQFDATSGANNGSSHTTLTWQHTITTLGSGRLLLVTLSAGAGAVTVSSVTFGGDSLTKLHDEDSGNVKRQWWYLLAPQTGAHNIVITYSGSQGVSAATAQSYTGVNVSSSSTAFGTLSTDSSTDGSATSIVISSLVGEIVVDAVMVNRSATGGTVDAAPTEAAQRQRDTEGAINGAGTVKMRATGSDVPGDTSVTVGWSGWSPSSTTAWHFAMTLHAAAPSKQRLTYYLANTYRSRLAGRTIIEDAYGREVPIEQLQTDKWMRSDGPGFPNTYKYSSNVDDPAVFYIEALQVRGNRAGIKTSKQSLLENLLSRLGGRAI